MDEFFVTRVMVEVEVSHQFDNIQQATNLIAGLLKVPAITNVKILNVSSNCTHNKPARVV
jgi:hypothetical protein